jgi:hypothetical protein
MCQMRSVKINNKQHGGPFCIPVCTQRTVPGRGREAALACGGNNQLPVLGGNLIIYTGHTCLHRAVLKSADIIAGF